MKYVWTLLIVALCTPAYAQYYFDGPYGYGRPPPMAYYNWDVQMRGGPPWYCRWYGNCDPRGRVYRYHTGEHCMMRPDDAGC